MDLKYDWTQQDERIARLTFEHLGGAGFDKMEEFLADFERLIIAQRWNLRKAQEEELEIYPTSTALTTSAYQKRFLNYDTNFPGLLFNSSFVAACSLFESTLKNVCVFLGARLGIDFEPESIQKNIIVKCKEFIGNQIGLDLSPLNQYWSKMLTYRTLRNNITHHGAIVKETDVQLVNYLKENEHIQIIPVGSNISFVITNRQFVFDYIQDATGYLIWIIIKTANFGVNSTVK